MEEVDARVISVRSLFRISVVLVYISEELFRNEIFVRNTLVYLLIFINYVWWSLFFVMRCEVK
jgi:hypothetical protein